MSETLTSEQQQVVEADSDFLLLACPGSGKTRSAAARIAALDAKGLRVAACSYTNVGADRIASMLAADHDFFFSPRHFNGTLHGLLLTYVVYPFAHLLGAGKAVRIRFGEWPSFGYKNDNKRRIHLDEFRRAPDGSLIFARPARWVGKQVAQVCSEVEETVAARKEGLFTKQGLISSDDAMWVALQILRENEAVARAVAGRFDELLIDEAQDTSELQLACLEAILETGDLSSLVMVGDLEQSIYAYQGASAEGCRELASGSGLATIEFSENHRSSQKLCDVASHFSGRDADNAVGPNRDCQIDPELFLYPVDEPAVAIEHFRERLGVHGLEPKNAAVLARSHSMVAKLGGHQELTKVNPLPRAAGRLAAALAGGMLDRRDVSRAETMIALGAFDQDPTDLDPDLSICLRNAAHRFIGDLPLLEGDLRSWILGAREAYDAAIHSFSMEPRRKASQLMKSSPSHSDFMAADVFSPPASNPTPQTVHALKGEERDAVMVVVNKHHGGDPAKQMQFLEASFTINGISEDEEEERRITYVALTRAERFCLLALPDDAKGRSVADDCKAIGFVSTN